MNNAATPVDSPSAASWTFAEDYVSTSIGVAEARDEATVSGLTPITTGIAATLKVLTRAIAAKNVVEIGTLMGASGLSFLEGMQPDGILTSIDQEADNQIAARRFFNEAGYVSSRFRLIAGSPVDIMPKLRDGAYDLVFINGDKLEYVEYVAGALRLLRHGGLLVVNDVLWHNQVADQDDESDESIIIREALEAVTTSESYTQALLPVGNGLLVAVKD
ncbi:MAG TPA: class I SAM-dependent methyltransferase [Tessaracoccus flavescens]|uniref:Class I SAM-dependent methyltransferase n=1 Tax=Tessaracoccus flavescens TaxID=399497 RepID=A0A921EPP2_9ACTN|nr:class I SAM-dependent methyltransferase [Tessaracoccus flavescens]